MEFGDLHNRGIANVGDFRGARLYNFVPPLPPKPGRRYLVPRGARRQFAGYSDILQRLERRLLHNGDDDDNSKQTVFVLSGLGGVGKSEIVLQFAEKHRDRCVMAELVVEDSTDKTCQLLGYLLDRLRLRRKRPCWIQNSRRRM